MFWYDILNENIEKSDKDIASSQKIFFEISKNLLNTKLLKINENIEIELTEVEFYFFDCLNHPDTFVHIDELQKTTNYLYVHKQAWSRGGIDITFGNDKYFGGILIRGIKYKDSYISGSATIKKYISNLIDNSINNYKSLQDYFEKNKKTISLIENENKNMKVLHSTRVGLKSINNPKFANALYRFIREDYLDEIDKSKFASYNNLKERTKIKAISSLTLDYLTNEKSAIEDIKNNSFLYNNIKLF